MFTDTTVTLYISDVFQPEFYKYVVSLNPRRVIFNPGTENPEFEELLTKKKAAYPDYRKTRNEMQELVRAQKNVERFFAEEKDTIEKAQTR